MLQNAATAQSVASLACETTSNTLSWRTCFYRVDGDELFCCEKKRSLWRTGQRVRHTLYSEPWQCVCQREREREREL